MSKNWSIRPSLKSIPIIIVIGIAIGIANYAMNPSLTLGQTLLLQTLTSFCIGFPLVVTAANAEWIGQDQAYSQRLIIFGLLFGVIGMVASEIELLTRTILFNKGSYQPFAGGGLYIFNAILSIILGFTFLNLFPVTRPETVTEDPLPADPPLATIPIKQGDAIHLLPVDALCLVEAADKYAYVYDHNGTRHLCDYSLGFLEDRLPGTFLRVHRRYIVNKKQIARIQPFDKNRFTISFLSPKVAPIKSSAGHARAVRDLIKL